MAICPGAGDPSGRSTATIRAGIWGPRFPCFFFDADILILDSEVSGMGEVAFFYIDPLTRNVVRAGVLRVSVRPAARGAGESAGQGALSW